MLNDYKYVAEIPSAGNHAGNKARDDVNHILNEMIGESIGAYEGAKRFDNFIDKIKYILNISTIRCMWTFFYAKKHKLIMQYPFYCNFILKSILVRCLKRNSTCLIVHDVDSLRNFGKDTKEQEVKLFNQCNKLIVHNGKMINALIKLGVKTEMINLQLFDYLRENTISKKHELGNTIAFAGNLAKSKFLRNDLDSLGLRFNLYGPNFDEDKIKSKCVKYNGSFSPNDIPEELDGSFGLIWDGDSLDTCSSEYGEYMRYNNPHKLSLYISAGIPVIVWKDSAVADFVIQEKIGFVVSDLSNINTVISNMDSNEYREYLLKISDLQQKVIKGEYLKKSLSLL